MRVSGAWNARRSQLKNNCESQMVIINTMIRCRSLPVKMEHIRAAHGSVYCVQRRQIGIYLRRRVRFGVMTASWTTVGYQSWVIHAICLLLWTTNNYYFSACDWTEWLHIQRTCNGLCRFWSVVICQGRAHSLCRTIIESKSVTTDANSKLDRWKAQTQIYVSQKERSRNRKSIS